MDMSRRYLVWALCYAAIGMVLGIYMAASHNHGQLVTHAHVLLVGFVVSLIYGIIHRLWLEAPRRALAMTQFVLHQAAAALLLVGLFLLYGGKATEETLAPVLGIGSIGVLLGMLLMLYMVVRPGTARSAEPGAPDRAAALSWFAARQRAANLPGLHHAQPGQGHGRATSRADPGSGMPGWHGGADHLPTPVHQQQTRAGGGRVETHADAWPGEGAVDPRKLQVTHRKGRGAARRVYAEQPGQRPAEHSRVPPCEHRPRGHHFTQHVFAVFATAVEHAVDDPEGVAIGDGLGVPRGQQHPACARQQEQAR